MTFLPSLDLQILNSFPALAVEEPCRILGFEDRIVAHAKEEVHC